ncbi:MAG TPA: phosphoadenosine phosphosulfate reductase family protein [Verrucomicrobiota bacterium]|nr:phosphoadenosine phosphosulfate reductase family protein [Verrucomicrobiota bacterium]
MKGGDNLDATRAGGRAWSEVDLAYGQLPAFRRKVAKALVLIAGAAQPLGVAFSGGKDSAVTLHLVHTVWPSAIAGFFDSGAELQDTRDLVANTPNVQVIPAGGGGLLELCRANGYWGHEPESPDPQVLNFGNELIFNPAREFVRHNNLATVALGLRAQESRGRRMNAAISQCYYHSQYDNVMHLCPLQWWTTDDIWAYIATYAVPYNAAYDKMTALGLGREEQRISTLLGTDAASFGRFVYLKRLDPQLWNRLVADFPLLSKYT